MNQIKENLYLILSAIVHVLDVMLYGLIKVLLTLLLLVGFNEVFASTDNQEDVVISRIAPCDYVVFDNVMYKNKDLFFFLGQEDVSLALSERIESDAYLFVDDEQIGYATGCVDLITVYRDTSIHISKLSEFLDSDDLEDMIIK